MVIKGSLENRMSDFFGDQRFESPDACGNRFPGHCRGRRPLRPVVIGNQQDHVNMVRHNTEMVDPRDLLQVFFNGFPIRTQLDLRSPTGNLPKMQRLSEVHSVRK